MQIGVDRDTACDRVTRMRKPKRLSDAAVAKAANMSLTAFRARNASFQQKLREDVEAVFAVFPEDSK